jgi:hypothetical protein
METQEIIDSISNQVLYSVGETITVIGLFITLVGCITMIYSHTPETKETLYSV